MRKRLIPILLALAFVAGALVAPAWLGQSEAERVTLNKYTGDPSLNGFRLTLTSGTAVTTADVTGATTLYYTPYLGDRIVLYDGSNWQLYSSAEVSLALGTLVNASNYDVWVRDVNGTLTLDFSTVWTNDTTRADAIATTNGVVHKSGDQTRRLAGTIRTTATTTTEDSAAKRFVWNASNRVARAMAVSEATVNWTYTTATYRSANNSDANRLSFVRGLAEDAVSASVHVNVSNNSTAYLSPGIGLDRTDGNDAQTWGFINIAGATYRFGQATYVGIPGIGYRYLQWVEKSQAIGTTVWISTDAQDIKAGITGTVWN